jgi:hypothetical protein
MGIHAAGSLEEEDHMHRVAVAHALGTDRGVGHGRHTTSWAGRRCDTVRHC